MSPRGSVSDAATSRYSQNKNTRGKIQKQHHASKVMFAEKVGGTMLVLHFPDKKDYKLNFVAPEDREMFCAKLVDLCKTYANHLIPHPHPSIRPSARLRVPCP